ncbi:MAG: DUF2182 domain-containing protein, partial [Gammaproteobacteria bacterium]
MSSLLTAIAARDRAVVTIGLLIVVLLAWGYLLAGAGMGMHGVEMTRMYYSMPVHLDATMQPMTWTTDYAVLMFSMWWIMMVAMMLPAAAPTILLAAALNRKTESTRKPFGGAIYFTLGYLSAWALFSAIAVFAQWALWESELLTPMLRSQSALLASAVLLTAGIWQFTPWKQTCLQHCRSPIAFLVHRRRAGNLGALAMGTEHGAYCLGCCWFLMLLLFVGGVMNLYWVVALTAYVWAEKVLPVGPQLRRVAG